MAKISGQITSVKLNGLENFARNLSKKATQYDVVMERNMNLATNMVWRLAHQKRPYISKEEQKRGFRTLSGNVHHNRVSDPNATLGVPVAWKNGGTLQSGIKKEVTRIGYGKYQGKVYVEGVEYGMAMEYGTSKVHARPFMRPAYQLLKNELKKLFNFTAGMK